MIKPSSSKLITVGDNCLDVYLSKDVMAVGGNALNVAVQWLRKGWTARYFGAVGKDSEGDVILDEISRVGLAAQDVERRGGDTAVTLLQENAGDRRFLLEDLGAGENYMPSNDRYHAMTQADWVHLGTNSSGRLVQQLVADNIPFSIDVSTAHFSIPLSGVPLVFAAGPEDPDESPLLISKALRDAGAQRVIVTCGERGAYFDDGITPLYQPAEKIDVVDTCGAGDSFIATFVTAFCCEEKPVRSALREATISAGETCLHQGGFPQKLRHIPAWLTQKYAGVIASAEEY
jgi:fructoselysine 6-kinase